MSTMSIEVVLKLLDELTAPLRAATSQLGALDRLGGRSGKSPASAVAGDAVAAGTAVKKLNDELAQLGGKGAASAAVGGWGKLPGEVGKAVSAVAGYETVLTAAGTATARIGTQWDADRAKINEATEAARQYARVAGAAPAPGGGGAGKPGAPVPGQPPAPAQQPVPGKKPDAPAAGGGFFGYAAQAGGLAVGIAGGKLIHETVKAGTDAQNISVVMQQAGLDPAERAEISAGANRLSHGKFKMFSQSVVEEATMDGRAVLGTTEHALQYMPEFLKLKAIAEAKQKSGGGGDKFAGMIRALELAGVTRTRPKWPI